MLAEQEALGLQAELQEEVLVEVQMQVRLVGGLVLLPRHFQFLLVNSPQHFRMLLARLLLHQPSMQVVNR